MPFADIYDIFFGKDLLNLLPDEWDWRSKGAVFPVSDQGPMGNVFAMVVSEAVSAYAFQKTRKLIKASAQELTDCCLNKTQSMLDPDDNDVYTCILGLRGLCLEADYPSAAESCSATKCVPKIKVRLWARSLRWLKVRKFWELGRRLTRAHYFRRRASPRVEKLASQFMTLIKQGYYTIHAAGSTALSSGSIKL